MTFNVGGFDRVVRLVLAAGMAYLGLTTHSGTNLGIVLDTIAAVAMLSAVVGICPLYSLLGIRTNKGDRSHDNA